MREKATECPITESDIEIIRKLAEEGFNKARSNPRNPISFCSIAIDWQSEDRKTFKRVARFGFSDNAESHKSEQLLADRLVEVINTGMIAILNGMDCNLAYQLFDDATHPNDFSHHRDYVLLWSGCGMLYMSIVSDAGEESRADEIIIEDSIYEGLEEHERFRDCRQYGDTDTPDWDYWYVKKE